MWYGLVTTLDSTQPAAVCKWYVFNIEDAGEVRRMLEDIAMKELDIGSEVLAEQYEVRVWHEEDAETLLGDLSEYRIQLPLPGEYSMFYDVNSDLTIR